MRVGVRVRARARVCARARACVRACVCACVCVCVCVYGKSPGCVVDINKTEICFRIRSNSGKCLKTNRMMDGNHKSVIRIFSGEAP